MGYITRTVTIFFTFLQFTQKLKYRDQFIRKSNKVPIVPQLK